MYRLLIVDDEELLVNGLYEVFRSDESLELDIYKAYSGQEALDWLNRTRMDIVITDIQMPEISGLRLLEEIETNWTQTRVIFLTGHSEFEYAYRAIQSPGVSYLLKTESFERIVDVVRNAITDIERDSRNEAMIQDAKEQTDQIAALFQGDYLLQLLIGNSSLRISAEQFRELKLPLKAGEPVLIAMGEIHGLDASLSYGERVQRFATIRRMILKFMASHVYSVTLLDHHYHLVLLVQPHQSQTPVGKTISFLEGTLEALQNACQIGLRLSIGFTIGGEMTHWPELSAKYYRLSQMLGYRIGSENESLLIDRESDIPLQTVGLELSIEEQEEMSQLSRWLNQRASTLLEQYMGSGQHDTYFTQLKSVLSPLSRVKSMHNPLAIEAYYTVAIGLLSFINRKQLGEKAAFRIGQYQLMRHDLFQTWQAAAEYLAEFSEVLFQLNLDEQKTRADQTVALLQQFIVEHIGEELSLVRLAEQVYLNPSYLSRIYKQETGVPLSTFIETVRMRKAKELLRDEHKKITEIAQQVGYNSPASFTRFFKNACGMSPQVYREQCALQKNRKNC